MPQVKRHRWLESRSDQAKDHTIGVYCLARSPDIVSEWSRIFSHRLVFSEHYNILSHRVDLVQSRHNHLSSVRHVSL
jgi:hypothetical protein